MEIIYKRVSEYEKYVDQILADARARDEESRRVMAKIPRITVDCCRELAELHESEDREELLKAIIRVATEA